jgi:hypothetical protein
LIGRFEREATGTDGERYAWSGLDVAVLRDGRFVSVCLFETDDEDAAFAYADERVRLSSIRLPLTNRARQTWDVIERAGKARDIDALMACYSRSLIYDDRRQMNGGPIDDMRRAFELLAEDYTQLDMRSLAVRGERLHLGYGLYRNDSGFESSSLWVHEVDDDGKIVYLCRFDEDDFNSAYRELERRYCVGEGARFAEIAKLGAEYLIALNEGAFDLVFNELTTPGMRVENRRRTGFPDRSVAEFRASWEELNQMAGPSRSWNSAVCWLSPNCGVVRAERAAMGEGNEDYAWSFLVVFEAADGRCTHICEFELDDEAAAFAYAEERVRRHAEGS